MPIIEYYIIGLVSRYSHANYSMQDILSGELSSQNKTMQLSGVYEWNKKEKQKHNNWLCVWAVI